MLKKLKSLLFLPQTVAMIGELVGTFNQRLETQNSRLSKLHEVLGDFKANAAKWRKQDLTTVGSVGDEAKAAFTAIEEHLRWHSEKDRPVDADEHMGMIEQIGPGAYRWKGGEDE